MTDSQAAKAFKVFRDLIATPTLPDLGPGPRADVQSSPGLHSRLDAFFAVEHVPAAAQSLLRAAALLWNDHHDDAHALVQNEPRAEGSFLHGILHRREPDYGNAKYWFRQVGLHPCFPVLAARVVPLVGATPGPELKIGLREDGSWDAFAFIDACAKVASLPVAASQVQFLQQVQAVEFEVLVEFILQGV